MDSPENPTSGGALVLPVRVQRQRRKGWTMPANTISVTRPGPFGNPFTITGAATRAGIHDGIPLLEKEAGAFCVSEFRDWLDGKFGQKRAPASDAMRDELRRRIPELRGKNLACWCKPGEPCHADVLLQIANARQGVVT